jgi:tRNA threonylcarbamoyladenosine biosynthesis protein TsaB
MSLPVPPPSAAPAPVLLAFDTATEQLAVALHAHGRVWTHAGPGGAAASAGLLPAAQGLLAQAGLGWPDVQAIAFGRGPGAFTGLRTSCAVAQGLALGLGCPVLPIDSLLIVAEDARAARAPLDDAAPFEAEVAMDARMDEAYAARYGWQADAAPAQWRCLRAPALMTLPALQAAWDAAAAPRWVAGSALGAFSDRLRIPGGAVGLPAQADRPAALLRLALAAHAAGAGLDAAQALPLYLRDKVAFTTAERMAERAAGGPAAVVAKAQAQPAAASGKPAADHGPVAVADAVFPAQMPR